MMHLVSSFLHLQVPETQISFRKKRSYSKDSGYLLQSEEELNHQVTNSVLQGTLTKPLIFASCWNQLLSHIL